MASRLIFLHIGWRLSEGGTEKGSSPATGCRFKPVGGAVGNPLLLNARGDDERFLGSREPWLYSTVYLSRFAVTVTRMTRYEAF